MPKTKSMNEVNAAYNNRSYGYRYNNLSTKKSTDEVDAAVMPTASQNNLPDSAFAIVLPGGKKDASGLTTPRSLRKLPYRTASGAIDPAHLRNALARVAQSGTKLTPSQRASAEAVLEKAKKSAGMVTASEAGAVFQKFVDPQIMVAINMSEGVAGTSTIPSMIPLLPVMDHQTVPYGKIKTGPQMFDELIANFEAGLRAGGTETGLPIDVDHDRKGAAGWIKKLINMGEKGLWGVIDWTPRGLELLQDKIYKFFSPSYSPQYTDPETGAKSNYVMQGGGLTNFPLIKELGAIVASENGVEYRAPVTAEAAPVVIYTSIPATIDASTNQSNMLEEKKQPTEEPKKEVPPVPEPVAPVIPVAPVVPPVVVPPVAPKVDADETVDASTKYPKQDAALRKSANSGGVDWTKYGVKNPSVMAKKPKGITTKAWALKNGAKMSEYDAGVEEFGEPDAIEAAVPAQGAPAAAVTPAMPAAMTPVDAKRMDTIKATPVGQVSPEDMAWYMQHCKPVAAPAAQHNPVPPQFVKHPAGQAAPTGAPSQDVAVANNDAETKRYNNRNYNMDASEGSGEVASVDSGVEGVENEEVTINAAELKEMSERVDAAEKEVRTMKSRDWVRQTLIMSEGGPKLSPAGEEAVTNFMSDLSSVKRAEFENIAEFFLGRKELGDAGTAEVNASEADAGHLNAEDKMSKLIDGKLKEEPTLTYKEAYDVIKASEPALEKAYLTERGY